MFVEDDPHPASRIISGFIVVVYIGCGALFGGPVAALRVLAFCLLPLGCIWFPEAMGDYVGNRINASSPAVFVWALGWAVLLMPVVAVFLLWTRY